MKTFKEFVLICEKLNKTHDEDSQNKLWNYFISNSKNKKVRDLILSNDFEEAEKEIKKEVEKAKSNSNHPLNFKNAGDEEFSKKEGRQANDEKPYNDFLDDSVSGLLALSKQKKLRSAIEKGLPSRVTGSSQAGLSKQFKAAGGVDKTPKGDLEIYDPNNSKYRVGISMKKGAGAQLASAEGGEIKGMYKIAAKEYIKRFHSGKSREEKQRIEKEIMNDAERLSAIGRLQKSAGEASDPDKQKQSLKNVSQTISDKLLNKHPQFERLLSQVATSGKGKFEGGAGTAGVVLTGRNKSKEASAKPSEQQMSSRPRLALPKGSNRPGNLKIDYRPQQPVSRQSTFSDFSKQAAATQKQHAQTAADLEQQAASAETDLRAAQQAAADARVVRTSSGKPVPRKNAFYLQNNPGEAQRHYQNVSVANDTVAAAQSAHDNAVTAHQTHINTPPPIPTKQQPAQSQQTSQTVQPSVPQPVSSPENEKEKRRRETRQRMDAAGQRLGVQ